MSSFNFNSNLNSYQYILDPSGSYTHMYSWFTSMGCSFSTLHRSNGEVKFTFDIISAQAVAAIEEIFVDEFADDFCSDEYDELPINKDFCNDEGLFEGFCFDYENFPQDSQSDRFSFNQCNSAFELKSTFRQLARIHHPDFGGSTKAMQELNQAYQSACLRF